MKDSLTTATEDSAIDTLREDRPISFTELDKFGSDTERIRKVSVGQMPDASRTAPRSLVKEVIDELSERRRALKRETIKTMRQAAQRERQDG